MSTTTLANPAEAVQTPAFILRLYVAGNAGRVRIFV